MTLETLYGLSADEWEKLTEKELLEIAQPFHHICKPPSKDQLKMIKQMSNPRKLNKVSLDQQMLQIQELAARAGIKI